MGRHSAPTTYRESIGAIVSSVGAGAMVAAGLAVGTAIVAAPAASAAESSAPSGSTISGPLNDLATGSAPFTDWLESVVSGIPGIMPGPYVGSTDGASGSSGLWDWNLQPYK